MASELEIKEELVTTQSGPVQVVRLSGRVLNLDSLIKLQERVAVQEPAKNVLLDVSKLKAIGFPAAHALVSWKDKVNNGSTELKVFGPFQGDVAQTLAAFDASYSSGLVKRLDCSLESEDKVLASFLPSRNPETLRTPPPAAATA